MMEAPLQFGDAAPGFALPGIDSWTYDVQDVADKRVLVEMAFDPLHH